MAFVAEAKKDWKTLVMISSAILAVLLLFKILFWFSVVAVVIGIMWMILNYTNESHEKTWIAVILIVGGIALASVSYEIGYEFEKSDLGKPIVDSAKAITSVDDTIKNPHVTIMKEAVKRNITSTG